MTYCLVHTPSGNPLVGVKVGSDYQLIAASGDIKPWEVPLLKLAEYVRVGGRTFANGVPKYPKHKFPVNELEVRELRPVFYPVDRDQASLPSFADVARLLTRESPVYAAVLALYENAPEDLKSRFTWGHVEIHKCIEAMSTPAAEIQHVTVV